MRTVVPSSKAKIAPTTTLATAVDLIPLPLEVVSGGSGVGGAGGTLSTNSSTATFTSAASPAGSPGAIAAPYQYYSAIPAATSLAPNPPSLSASQYNHYPYHQSHSNQNQPSQTQAPPVSQATPTSSSSSVSQYATTSCYSRNPSTTRSWPVISRTYQQYDYEALYKLTGNGGGGSGSGNGSGSGGNGQCSTTYQHQQLPADLGAIQLAAAGDSANAATAPGGGGGGLNNNNNLEYCSSYDKDSSSDQNLYVSSSLARSMQTVDAVMTCQSRRHTQTTTTTTTIVPNSGGNAGGGGGSQTPQMTLTAMLTCANAPPPLIFLLVTLLVTTSATAILCGAMMSDHWEHVTWDRVAIDRMTRNKTQLAVEWHLDDRVGAVTYTKQGGKDTLFLVPMNGGIWTLCIDLSDEDRHHLAHIGFPRTQNCVNYMADSIYTNNRGEELWRNTGFPANYHPQLRMQNLSISCSLVCMIILGSAALLGSFGVCARQISAILITGVMYLLAALFAVFTLMIIYVKRNQVRPIIDAEFEGTIEGLVASRSASHIVQQLLVGRIFSTSWSIDLGWLGIVLCTMASAFWIMLSKIMRYNNPLSSMLS